VNAAEIPAVALVERPGDGDEIRAAIEYVRSEERTRRRLQILMAISPWLVALACAAFAAGQAAIYAKRPVPVPQVDVAIYESDGSLSQPVERGRLSADRRGFIIRSDLANFVKAWESYAWRRNQDYYNRISSMTSGTTLQVAYQKSWSNRNDPGNREVKYGTDKTRDIVQMRLNDTPGSPYAADARMLVKLATPTGAVCEWWSASLTWKQDHDTIPHEVQLAYDPSDIVVVSYFSTPADPAGKPWSC